MEWRPLLVLVLACWPSNAARAQSTWVAPGVTGASGHAMVYDVARERVVRFGGWQSPSLPETWEWDGATWLQRRPKSSPPARAGHGMAYDLARRRTVLFGGWPVGDPFALNALADTWEWDGSEWTRRNPVLAPPALGDTAMTYDLARQRVVLFGGTSMSGGSPFTWEWDGTIWIRRAPTVSPPQRDRSALAYDVVRQRVVLFGGRAGSDLGDTWEWDGVNWLQRSPVVSPSSRSLHAMTYDLARRKVLLHGGSAGGSEGWEWDGTQWLLVGALPGGGSRQSHALAYDAVRDRTVLFGGLAANPPSTALADTWERDPLGWRLRTSPSTPSPTGSARMAYDSLRDRVVLFDGQTWEWDGRAWALLTPSASPGFVGPLAYDAARARTVLFAGSPGSFGETWEWDGATWLRRIPANSAPARVGHALAYDSKRQRLVLFGGADPSGYRTDTWEWDGATWLLASAAGGPAGREGHGLAYDEARQRVVLHGGHAVTTGFGDTWEWDGSTWLLRSNSGAIGALAYFGICYDRSRACVVVHGGSVPFAIYPRADTWIWDGNAWRRDAPANVPIARDNHALVYVDTLGCPLAFGGRSYSREPLADLWVYSSVPSGALVFGAACSSSSAATLLTSTAPMLGSAPLRLELLQARPVAAYLIGLSAGTQSLPIAACTLYLRDPIVPLFGITNWAGVASAPGLALPSDPALRGVPFYAQGFVADPQGPALGMTFTAGLTLRLGD